jgi:hypothetical protein
MYVNPSLFSESVGDARDEKLSASWTSQGIDGVRRLPAYFSQKRRQIWMKSAGKVEEQMGVRLRFGAATMQPRAASPNPRVPDAADVR